MKKTLLTFLSIIIGFGAYAQTTKISGFVTSSGQVQAGVRVFYYGKNYSDALQGPRQMRGSSFTGSNGAYEINIWGTVAVGDTIFTGVIDCNGNNNIAASVYSGLPGDTLVANFQLICSPGSCDYFLFDSIMPAATGVNVSMIAYNLRDSNQVNPPGAALYLWEFSDSTSQSNRWGADKYGIDTTQPLSVCFTPYVGCQPICMTLFSGSTPPPPPVPDPNIVCNAGWYLDTVNSIVFNGNLIVWDASTATDTNGTPVNITSYFWDFGDGNFSNQQYPTHTYTDTGWQTLCLTITAVNGVDTCSSTFCDSLGIDGNGNILYKGGSASGFTLQVIDPATVSLKETESMELVLYPNPATNEVNLSWASSANEVKLYNLSGALLQTKNVEGLNKITLNTSEIPSGVYLISISGDNSKEQIRFVKN